MKGKLNAIELFIFGFTAIGIIIFGLIWGDIFNLGQGVWYVRFWGIVAVLFKLLFGGFVVGVILSFVLGLPMRFFVNVIENKWKFNRSLWTSFIYDMKDVFPYSFITNGIMEVIFIPVIVVAFVFIVFILFIISSFYKIFLSDYGIQLSIDLDAVGWPWLLSLILPGLFLFILYKISNFLKINTLKVILFLTGVLIVMPNLYRLGLSEKMNENSILHLSMLVKLCFGVLLILISILIANNSKEEVS